MATTLHHWKNGATFEGSGGRFSDVTNPATGEVSAQLALASEADVNEVVAAAAAAFPGWRDTSLAKRTQILFAFRELLNARKPELAAIITAEHGKVLSDALGEVSRGQEVVEFACGIPHLIKGAFTENASTKVDVHSVRQPLGRGRDHLPVQLPGDGADVVLPDRHRRRQHGGAEAEREGADRGAVDGRAVEGGRAARRGVQRAERRQGRGRRPAHPPRGRSRSPSSAPPRSPGTSTRPAPRTASGCRRWAGRRTTCWCCPTPTSTWPPTRRSTPASARRGSAAWRSRRCWPSATSATSWWTRSRSGRSGCGPATAPAAATWARWSPPQARDRVSGYVDAGEAAGATLVVDGRGIERGRRRRGVLRRPDPVRPRHHRHEHLHRRDLRPGAVGACGSTATPRACS